MDLQPFTQDTNCLSDNQFGSALRHARKKVINGYHAMASSIARGDDNLMNLMTQQEKKDVRNHKQTLSTFITANSKEERRAALAKSVSTARVLSKFTNAVVRDEDASPEHQQEQEEGSEAQEKWGVCWED